MKITSVKYSALANLGNYRNEKVELTAELQEGDSWQETLDQLKCFVHEQLNDSEEYYKHQALIRKCRQEIKTVNEETEKARNAWKAASNFLVKQGLKEETDSFPNIPLLVASKSVIDGEVIEGEF